MRNITLHFAERPEPTIIEGMEIWPDYASSPVLVEDSDFIEVRPHVYERETPAHHWEILVTPEQYAKRQTDKASCVTFSTAPEANKKLAAGKLIPRHSFGGSCAVDGSERCPVLKAERLAAIEAEPRTVTTELKPK